MAHPGRTAGLISSVVLAVNGLLFAQTLPAMPQAFVDTTYEPPAGQIITVAAGGRFQAALDNAQPGDVMTLTEGATSTGNFTLRNKPGDQWITIRSSAPDSRLPLPGTRLTPAFSRVLPKLVTAVANQPVVA